MESTKLIMKTCNGFNITKVVESFKDSNEEFMLVILKRQTHSTKSILEELGIPTL